LRLKKNTQKRLEFIRNRQFNGDEFVKSSLVTRYRMHIQLLHVIITRNRVRVM